MAEIRELTIEKLVYGGDGLARIPSTDGRQQAVFVPFVLPGEVVRVELEPPARGRTTARVIEILQPAPERITPLCEYFGRCGGCQLQHAPAELQLELKRGMLIETLRRTGGLIPGEAWTGDVALHAAEPWAYRNRVRLQRTPEGVGYYERDSHRVLPVTHCPIASASIEAAIGTLAPGEREEIELAVDNDDHGLASDAPLEFSAAGHRYRVSAGSFFQVNRFLTEELVEVVTGGVSGTAGSTAIDLFSGVGLFALPLVDRGFSRVHAVESHPAAYEALRFNVASAKAVRASRRPALEFVRQWKYGPPDLVVADPPRTGLGREMVAALLEAAPRRLHLVSCDPATLGRDLRGLLAAGYRITEMHLLDLFPQTYHLETVVKLSLG
ncbi:MAG TPA: class I SAM-dependent RNA methyltransferase [Terriglobales bacterium]|jgi:23S rRNA (uracil1939-C5)-methyltransferase